MLVDLKVAQLLCSKLCHDLVGPAGAVTVGMELLQEDPQGADEALELINFSGQQVVRRLAFFRMAFGVGGGATGVPLAEIRNLATDMMADGSVALNWPIDDGAGERLIVAPGGNLILNLILLAIDSLPRGGRLDVQIGGLAEGWGVALTAAGQGARFREEVLAAIQPGVPAEDLTARTVHGYFAQRLAESLGGAIEITDAGGDQVRLAAVLPGLSD